MSRLIIHPGTGLIVDADECVIINTDLDTDEIEQRLDEIVRVGRPVVPETEEDARRMVSLLADQHRWLLVLVTQHDVGCTSDARWEHISLVTEGAATDWAIGYALEMMEDNR